MHPFLWVDLLCCRSAFVIPPASEPDGEIEQVSMPDKVHPSWLCVINHAPNPASR